MIRIIRSSLGDGEDRAKAMAEIVAAGGDRQSQIGHCSPVAPLALAKVDVRAPGPDGCRPTSCACWLA